MKELKEIEFLLKNGKISRREFLTRASALGITAALSPSLLTTFAHASEPKKGGRLRIGSFGGTTGDALDPALINNFFLHNVTLQLRNCLVEIDHNANALPKLAESWEFTPDAKKWVFKLRKGVEFHNGKIMDAEDVIYSINYHRGEKSKSPAKVILNSLKEIKADGKHTVVFTLEDGDVEFPYTLSNFHLQIIPNGTTKFDDGIGTGAYKLEAFEPGVRSITKRNPNYFKKGRAHFDEVETISIKDIVARTNALTTGRIDVMSRCDRKTIHLLEKKPGIQVIEVTGKLHYSIPMLTDVEPYNNNNVRLGLKHAIDREQVLKILLRGHGTVGNDHPISPAYQYYAPELEQRKYDPDKAKFYLKKGGLNNHTFKLHVAPNSIFPGAQDLAVLYKEQASKSGINIEVVAEPDDAYWSSVWMKKPWCFSFWLGRETANQQLTTAYTSGAAWNDTHWKNERFDKLVKEARSELNEAKRREMYVEMQKILRDEGGVVIPVFANYIYAATNKLKFEKVASNFELDGMKLAERWWFES